MNNYTDGHIWDGLTTPDGLDKTTLINNIMLQYGEMETLYADPDFMKFAIKTWSDKNAWGMQKALAAISFHYEPLYNYDRTETRTYSGSESGTNTGTVTDAGSHSTTTGSSVSTSATTTTDRDETNETEHKVSAYDSSTYSPDNTDDGSNTFDETVTSSASSTASGTDSGTTGNTRTDNLAHAKQDSHTETVRAYGNIGVTTSQQMLNDELQLALYNIYDTFAGIFAYDLLLMVY